MEPDSGADGTRRRGARQGQTVGAIGGADGTRRRGPDKALMGPNGGGHTERGGGLGT
jgi:hypothetical protein